MPEILYTLSFDDASNHYVDVDLYLSGFDNKVLELKMAVWTPGSYMIREYSKNIVSLAACADPIAGAASAASPVLDWLPVLKTSKNTFQLRCTGNRHHIRYRIYAADFSVRTSYVDQYHAYLNGAGIFLYVHGYQHLRHTVTFSLPAAWKQVASSLPGLHIGDLTGQAENYTQLVDSPVSLGNFSTISFEAAGINHELIAYNCDEPFRAVNPAEIRRIIETEVAIFGSHPSPAYLFQLNCSGTGRGGLEHRDSCSLMLTPSTSGAFDKTEFLSLLAHEYFHLWNGKRLCPAELYTFDYESENYTRLLWVVEGFTVYYESQVLLRAGLLDIPAYLKIIESTVSHYLNQPGRLVQSLSDSSFDAWIKFYLPNENSANTTISYYQKGSLIALLLDLEIIELTLGQYSLDTVMMRLYTEVYLKQQRGYTLEDLKLFLGEYLDVDFFLARFVNGLAGLELGSVLHKAGLTLEQNLSDAEISYLGVSVHKDLHTVLQVRAHSPAANAGLSAGDEILSLDGVLFTSLSEQLALTRPGQSITIVIKRAFQKHELLVLLTQSPIIEYTIGEAAGADFKQRKVYECWLQGR